jgi:predicted nucleic acid-binding Zn ribbon protein
VSDNWDPDGVDLAKALVARAKANSRAGGVKRPRRKSGRSSPAATSSSGTGWSGPGHDDRDPQPLMAAVEKLANEHGWEEDLSVHGVIARWDELVGPEVAAHVAPERYEDTVLTVRADSTAWATQVRLLAQELVRRINVAVGHGTVTRVEVLGPQARSWVKGPRSVPGRGPRDTYG